MRLVRSAQAPLLSLLLLAAACGGDEADPDAMPAEQEPAALTQAEIDAAAADLECHLTAEMGEAMQRPSPLGQTPIVLGRDVGKVCYGSPRMNGRTVMDSLVPYGEPWRAGANEATAIHLPFAARIGTVDVEPGSYSLFVIPDEGSWEVVVNSNYQRWGIPISDEVRSSDVGSFTVTPEAAPSTTENLTYSWEAEGPDMGHLVLTWEDTRVEIPIRKTM